MSKLPEVCSRCRKVKMPHLGEFSFARGRYNRRIWTCFECRGKQPALAPRIGRQQHPPSPVEREVSKTLAELNVGAVQEYQLPGQPFFYDFAVPSLRLLLEVDTHSYHNHRSRQRRDRIKSERAEEANWKLVRIEPPNVGLKAQLAVERRQSELG